MTACLTYTYYIIINTNLDIVVDDYVFKNSRVRDHDKIS